MHLKDSHIPPSPDNAAESQTDLPPLPSAGTPEPTLPEIPFPPPPAIPEPSLPEVTLPPPPATPEPSLPEVTLPPPPAIPEPSLPEVPLPPPPVTPPSNSGQKNQLSWLIPAAVAILAAGGGLSYYLHTEKKAFAEQTVQLEKDAEALSETITLLRQKQEEARKGNQTKLLKEKENSRLLETLQKKEKAVEQIRQKHNSVLAEQSNATKRIEALEKELGAITRNNIGIPGNSVERVNSSTVKPPIINPPCPETDKSLLQTSLAYLRARKQGTATALADHFAPYCNYQYANNREVSKEIVINDVRKFWNKWPQRNYRLLEVAYKNNHVEIIYIYKYAGQRGRSLQGYAKEIWETNSIGQIIHWREELNSKTPPAASEGYRIISKNN
ncbi:hypothetical protein [Akkermansia sp. KLE1798]|uniref:hypothetical protein n=1 Tax=unclassified Akkermansia TaxID=2608915 RepID=UPI00082D445D|nr:hypothetical protein [Akkermansia sp. KLE1798]